MPRYRSLVALPLAVIGVAGAQTTVPRILPQSDREEVLGVSDPEIELATTPADRDVGWWSERHGQKLAERDAWVDRGESPVLVFVGDSITHGWERAGRALWEERYAGRGALNLGYSGDRTEHVLWRLGVGEAGEANNEVAGLTPKLFVVMIGTNNTGHRQDAPEATAAGVKAIVDRLLEVSPASQVLLLAVFPRGAASDDPLRAINDAVNKRLSGLGEREQVDFVDINDAFLDQDGALPESIMPDLLHPNAQGYALWAEALEPHLQRLLDE